MSVQSRGQLRCCRNERQTKVNQQTNQVEYSSEIEKNKNEKKKSIKKSIEFGN